MNIAIFGREFDSVYNEPIQLLIEGLNKQEHQLIFFNELGIFLSKLLNINSLSTFTTHEEIKHVDLLISIGGDGTILNTLDYIRKLEIPVLGINTGRLGFLSTVNTDEIDAILNAISTRSYYCESRAILELKTADNLFAPVNYALNEVAVHKNDRSAMITISAYLDGEYLNAYWADGLIISTATGSTAYSMSCGGPIVLPDAEVLIITPIAPHNLNVRPVVISDKITIRLEIQGRSDQHLVSLDSRSISIDSAIKLEIKKADFEMKLVRLKGREFVDTIRAKLNWGIDRRN